MDNLYFMRCRELYGVPRYIFRNLLTNSVQFLSRHCAKPANWRDVDAKGMKKMRDDRMTVTGSEFQIMFE